MNARGPARLAPLLYLGTAHAALALACLLAGLWPRAVAGFFYHAWMLALVHLVTLGWITCSILGAFYIVGPIALRVDVPARRVDYLAYALILIGLVGMVGHFWIQEYGGMAWSAGTAATGLLVMTLRIVGGIRRARVQRAVKLHIVLASVNLWLAAGMGVLLAWNKVDPFLPGFVLWNVYAHAHLAALGWAAMMVMGVGYRLLPMTFPSKMPSGPTMYASAVLLEIGVLGLFATLVTGSRWSVAFGASIAGAIAAFLMHVVWMWQHPAPRQPGVARLDFAVLHAAAAGVSLAAATAIGLTLLLAPASPRTLHAAAAYGVLGLVGFLGQMIVAMEARLLPTAGWFWAYAASGYQVPPPAPHAMRDRARQAIVFAGWTVGVPALAVGMFLESAGLVALGAWALFAGVVIAALDTAVAITGRRGYRSAGDRSTRESDDCAFFTSARASRSADSRSAS